MRRKQKMCAQLADEAPNMIRMEISFFGGHGIIEDFLSLPRFHRDSMIMELWKGPRNVLLTQIHRDLQRVKKLYPPDEFITDLISGANSDVLNQIKRDFIRIISHESLLRNDDETLTICRDWQNLSNKIFKPS